MNMAEKMKMLLKAGFSLEQRVFDKLLEGRPKIEDQFDEEDLAWVLSRYPGQITDEIISLFCGNGYCWYLLDRTDLSISQLLGFQEEINIFDSLSMTDVVGQGILMNAENDSLYMSLANCRYPEKFPECVRLARHNCPRAATALLDRLWLVANDDKNIIEIFRPVQGDSAKLLAAMVEYGIVSESKARDLVGANECDALCGLLYARAKRLEDNSVKEGSLNPAQVNKLVDEAKRDGNDRIVRDLISYNNHPTAELVEYVNSSQNEDLHYLMLRRHPGKLSEEVVAAMIERLMTS